MLGKFIARLIALIGTTMAANYGVFAFADGEPGDRVARVVVILMVALIGIAGDYGVSDDSDLETGDRVARVVVILIFSLIAIAGSYGVAWYGICVNTFAKSRTPFASLRGKRLPVYAIPLKAGMSIGMLLISVELI